MVIENSIQTAFFSYKLISEEKFNVFFDFYNSLFFSFEVGGL